MYVSIWNVGESTWSWPGSLRLADTGGAAVREAFASANRGDKEGAAGFAVRVARDAGRYSPCQKRFSANAPAAWRAQA